MESNLDNIVDSMMRQDRVTGVVVADSQGLAYSSELRIILINYDQK